MNAVCGYLWLLSAVTAAAVSFKQRGEALTAVKIAAVVLAIQTGLAFVLLGFVQSLGIYATRADLVAALMGPALAISVPLFWWRLLCWHRDSNTTMAKG